MFFRIFMIDEPINWQNIVEELLQVQGRTQKELQKITGVPQSTISEILNGHTKKRLSFDNGIALLRQLKKDNQTTPHKPK
nr:MAG TPA: helix-turn-helix protein [Caudoviricetes sp.]